MKIGFAHGCFDLLHEGHLHFLQEARSQCDYLIVAVNYDDSVRRLKGVGRPVQTIEVRLQALHERASAFVDAIIPFDGAKGFLIERLRPAIYFGGYDQHVTLELQHRLNGIGCAISKISHLPGYSTTLQIEDVRSRTNA